jgi:hypothetical protein
LPARITAAQKAWPAMEQNKFIIVNPPAGRRYYRLFKP